MDKQKDLSSLLALNRATGHMMQPNPGDYVEFMNNDESTGFVVFRRIDGMMIATMPLDAYMKFMETPVKEATSKDIDWFGDGTDD